MANYYYIDVLVAGGNPVLEDEIERILGQKKAGSCDEGGNRRITFYYSFSDVLRLAIARLSQTTDFFISVEFGKVSNRLVT